MEPGAGSVPLTEQDFNGGAKVSFRAASALPAQGEERATAPGHRGACPCTQRKGWLHAACPASSWSSPWGDGQALAAHRPSGRQEMTSQRQESSGQCP